MTPTPLVGNFVGVQLPADANKVNIITGKLIYFEGEHPIYELIILPPANYKLICLSSSATHADASAIVEHDNDGSGVTGWWYKDYENDSWIKGDALKSLASLLTSKHLTGNVAILEIVK
jgi:hypothetical protein